MKDKSLWIKIAIEDLLAGEVVCRSHVSRIFEYRRLAMRYTLILHHALKIAADHRRYVLSGRYHRSPIDITSVVYQDEVSR